ncbi:MAG: ATP synthase subunit I [Gallionella sp.]|nr:ATP synthase subunit I [Gallionella sp.]MDD4945396.1 ATP synthase subunit I [Gallionella sp.]
MADVIKDNAGNSETLAIQKPNRIAGMEETKNTIKIAFQKAARWQLLATLTAGIATVLLISINAGVSVILGGLSAVIGGYVGVLMTHKRVQQSPGGMLIALLKAEATKVLVIAAQLLVIFKNYEGLVPLALIGGLAISVLVAGAGLGAVGKNEQ